MRRLAGVLTIVVLLLLTGSPAQIGQPPKQALSPQLYQGMKADSDVLAEMQKQISNLSAIASGNVQHLLAHDQRISSLEDRFEKHELGGASAPTSIAVLQSQLNSVIEGQKQDRAVATWILTGVGSLILGLLGVLAKSIISKGIPPEWAAAQSDQVAARLQVHEQKQDEYRDHVLSGLQVVKDSADQAYREANTVNMKLAAIGVEVRDGKPLKQE